MLECLGMGAQVLGLERRERGSRRAPVVPAPAHALHAVGRRVRQRPQQHGLNEAEDGGVRADAERQREDGDCGERGLAAEGT